MTSGGEIEAWLTASASSRSCETRRDPRWFGAEPPSRTRPVASAADEFGLDPEFRARALPLFRLLYEKYWRVEADGARHVPKSGPVILVSNHSGALPFDATMIACALEEARYPRPTRFLYDRFVENLPWVPDLLQEGRRASSRATRTPPASSRRAS